MKRVLYFLFAVLTVATISFTSCNEYKSFSTATKLSELSGNPFYYQLSKSLLKNIGTFLVEKGIKKTVGKVNLTTPISSILTTTDHITAFKDMLAGQYKIPTKKLDGNTFDKVATVKDLVGFIAKNGNHFNFYNQKY